MPQFSQDVQDLVASANEAQNHQVPFMLWPRQWAQYQNQFQFQWTRVCFADANAVLVPANAAGLYCFVAEPGLANHPACSYLLYVGMTDRQSLRARYYQYLHEPSKRKGRPHIQSMLYRWDGYLYFYYAEVANISLIAQLEHDLIQADIPPMNKTLPASIRQVMGAF